MKTIYALLALVVLGIAMLPITRVGTKGDVGSKTKATNGAFRDGAFLGNLAAMRGEPPHISKG